MMPLDLPKLRPLGGRALEHEGRQYVQFDDSLGVASASVLVPIELFHWVVRRFDGQTSLTQIQVDMLRQTGHMLTTAELQTIVGQLDAAMVLDGPTFARFLDGYRQTHTRPAALAGRSYAASERALRAQLGCYFAEGAGPPGTGNGAPHGPVRGILCPHVDFARGGLTYTWAYKELIERTEADVFVILGVAHQYCRHRFALTRKDFETPLGLARTERAYVDRIAALAGDHLFDDELAHRTEHSIEFQVVFLQHLLGGRRDFSIAPILVGSFHDLMEAGLDPIFDAEVRRFVDALKAAESASGRRVAYIGGIDLSHVGPEFGDPEPLDAPTLDVVRQFDQALLDRATAADPTGWFATAAEVDNRYRVCGLAATYTMLHALGPVRGRLLRYDQAVNPERTCGVTFASVAYDGPD